MPRRIVVFLAGGCCLVPAWTTRPLGAGHSQPRSLQTPDEAGCVGPDTWSALTSAVTQDPYDARSRPNATGNPIAVEVQLYATFVDELDEKSQRMGLSGYFRVWWTDERLAYTPTSEGGCFDDLQIEAKDRARVWQPNLYFDNVLSEQYGASLLSVSPTGSIWRSQHVSHTFECHMEFGKLPFDKQTCRVVIASYSEDALNVQVRPVAEGLSASDEVQLGTKAWAVSEMTATRETRWFGANLPWDYVTLTFHLERRSGYHLERTVITAVFFVFVSYSGFFQDRTVAPSRVAVALFPVLIIINLTNAVFADLPQDSGRIWLTDYLMLCMLWCFFSIFEFGFVAYLLHAEHRNKEKLAALMALARRLIDQRIDLETRGSLCLPQQPAPVLVDFDEPKTILPGEVINEAPRQDLPAISASRSSKSRASTAVKATNAFHKMGTKFAVDADLAASTGLKINDLPPLQKRLVDHTFHLFDSDGSGTISKSNMRRALRGFTMYFTVEQINEIFCSLGLGPVGEMSYLEFFNFLQKFESVMPTEDFRKGFWDQPPSLQVDLVMRRSYLFCFGFVSGLFVLLVDLY